jgi:hypothetical protein
LNWQRKTKKYSLNSVDFNTKFVKINSKCYEINYRSLLLTKINDNITLNNHFSIVKLYFEQYLYCDASNNLILFKYETRTILDNQVDMIFYCVCNKRDNRITIIYKKIDAIIYSSYLYSCLTFIDTYTINYEGSHIVKKLDMGYFLDSDNDVYAFTFVDNKCILKKIISDIVDINSYNSSLYIWILSINCIGLIIQTTQKNILPIIVILKKRNVI